MANALAWWTFHRPKTDGCWYCHRKKRRLAARCGRAKPSPLRCPWFSCAVPTMGRRRCCPATMPVSAPCRAPPPSIICWSAGRIVRRADRQKSGWSSRNIFACWIQRWFFSLPSRSSSHLCCCIRTICCHARGSGPVAIHISRQHHGHGTAEHGALPAITAFLEEEALKSIRFRSDGTPEPGSMVVWQHGYSTRRISAWRA